MQGAAQSRCGAMLHKQCRQLTTLGLDKGMTNG